MALRCKPGDLAIILHAADERLIGRVATVVRWTWRDIHGFKGWILDVPSCPWASNDYACRDEYLMPIGGVPVSDDVHDEEELHA
ncbi:hypothetical protein [Paraburkholderia sacchari]|uniref:hypothetical protein n=1 Tax=Paraburkholderia sacchari TaxID=159450 RepID=UPI001BCE4204|nr:hypothetical protein [Paraburkholderia sacchari]